MTDHVVPSSNESESRGGPGSFAGEAGAEASTQTSNAGYGAPERASAEQSSAEQTSAEQTAPDTIDPSADGGRLELATGQWHRVSPKYVTVEIVSSLFWGLVFVAVGVVLVSVGLSWGWIALAVAIILAIVFLVVAPRSAKAIGYQLRDDDLLFRRGIMFQRFVSVPYGRMQLIDVNRGPLARGLGLSDLKFVTAAASTGVSIPGIPAEEAEELRDHLVALAESRRAGL